MRGCKNLWYLDCIERSPRGLLVFQGSQPTFASGRLLRWTDTSDPRSCAESLARSLDVAPSELPDALRRVNSVKAASGGSLGVTTWALEDGLCAELTSRATLTAEKTSPSESPPDSTSLTAATRIDSPYTDSPYVNSSYTDSSRTAPYTDTQRSRSLPTSGVSRKESALYWQPLLEASGCLKHEFNNHLTTLANSRFLATRSISKPEQLVESVVAEVEELTRLLDDFRALLGSSGRMQVRSLLEGLLRLYSPKLCRYGSRVEVAVEPTMEVDSGNGALPLLLGRLFSCCFHRGVEARFTDYRSRSSDSDACHLLLSWEGPLSELDQSALANDLGLWSEPLGATLRVQLESGEVPAAEVRECDRLQIDVSFPVPS